MSQENDELQELADEIRRLIESNRQFLARVNDEEYEDEEEGDSAEEPDAEDFEEL